MDKIKVLVCAHKQDSNTRNGGIYQAIQVGKALHPELDMGYLNDNVGDNISEKNPYWSEFTALYWGWKNLKDVEYAGLCHYRRYFGIDITEDNIDKLMEGYDMITINQTFKMYSKNSRPEKLMKMTSYEDYYLYLDSLLSIYPQYKQKIIDYFYNSRLSVPFTMFIAKKELYDEFCAFVFPVLFDLEKRIKPHGYTRQKRAMGYFGEFSLGLFILCKGLKIREVPLDMCGVIRKGTKRLSLFSAYQFWVRRLWDIMTFVVKSPTDIIVPEEVKAGFKQDGIQLKALI